MRRGKCASLAHAALYRKSDLCVPEMKLRGLLVPNSYIHGSVRDLYIFPGSVCLFGCRKIGRPILEIYTVNPSQIHECENWETEHYNSVLEITRPRSFISGNSKIRTRHLYWILTRPFICSASWWFGVYNRQNKAYAPTWNPSSAGVCKCN
jgi:hypothetical protein